MDSQEAYSQASKIDLHLHHGSPHSTVGVIKKAPLLKKRSKLWQFLTVVQNRFACGSIYFDT
jgi:hypothetical protein